LQFRLFTASPAQSDRTKIFTVLFVTIRQPFIFSTLFMQEEVVGQRSTTAEELQSDIQYKCCDPASSAGQASGTMP
jgi:hypothetical protein